MSFPFPSLPIQVIGIHDLGSIYHVPLLLEKQRVVRALDEALELGLSFDTDAAGLSVALTAWRQLTARYDGLVRPAAAPRPLLDG